MSGTPETLLEPLGGEYGEHRDARVVALRALVERLLPGVADTELPVSGRLMLEALARSVETGDAPRSSLRAAAEALAAGGAGPSFPFLPARLVMQDFTAVPAFVELAALREDARRIGAGALVEPLLATDVVVDHSVIVDRWGTPGARALNEALEFERNAERYAFLAWCDRTYATVTVHPPGTGIVHQVNLERLASVATSTGDGGLVVPDNVCGTDSHTTMANALGVLGWGVGGLEATSLMLGRALPVAVPVVVGVELVGSLPPAVSASDLVLHLTAVLRAADTVGAFVEFHGPGLDALSLPDRATVANMAPEFGATCAFFPVDHQTLSYLRATGRSDEQIDRVERYHRQLGLFREPGSAGPTRFARRLRVDLGAIETAVAGPSQPDQWVALSDVPEAMRTFARERRAVGTAGEPAPGALPDGAVVLAAITSCTTTANPALMVTAGLLARNARQRGLRPASHVKCSLSPGSPAVPEYLRRLDLLDPLADLGFHVVGLGCMTCNGNSGALVPGVAEQVADGLVAAAVLSGNRNFSGRIHAAVPAAFLASPALVVAYALAGRVDLDLATTPLGMDDEGRPVLLAEIWPSQDEIDAAAAAADDPGSYEPSAPSAAGVVDGWAALPSVGGDDYAWDARSTYVRRPPFTDPVWCVSALREVRGARVLVALGDGVTTDHISPGGAIDPAGPAGRHLAAAGVGPGELNVYGARRGNHEVMVRGAFANPRLRNHLVAGSEGGVTRHPIEGTVAPVHDVAEALRDQGVPLLVVAGARYGSGSSRDWAAKAVRLLGVRAVLAESFERIHRANLVHAGVLPLAFRPGESWRSWHLDGTETIDLRMPARVAPGAEVAVDVHRSGGEADRYVLTLQIDNDEERLLLEAGGLLPAALDRLRRGDA